MARLRTRREERSRKLTFKIFAGMFDYVATIAGALIIVLCVVLLVQLYRWISSTFEISFGEIYRMFQAAVRTK